MINHSDQCSHVISDTSHAHTTSECDATVVLRNQRSIKSMKNEISIEPT